jgi:choice-of-anchor B domain-containing protein
VPSHSDANFVAICKRLRIQTLAAERPTALSYAQEQKGLAVHRSLPWISLLLAASVSASHDDELGARFVQSTGANASDCLDHDVPCQSIQYALTQAQPGNTVKAAAGIYDMTGVDPESFLFGAIKASGGYSEDDHFSVYDPDANRTILIGVDARYRQPMAKQGFKWAADRASAERGMIDNTPAPALQATQAAAATCVQGFAAQFPCRNVDFLAQIPLNGFSTLPTSAANVWGFVDLNDNREYALVGLRNGTAVVDVTDPANPREIATVAGNPSPWREVKVYQYRDVAANRFRAFAYISTEAPGAGLQVINLSGLPNSVALATTLMDTSRQHTLYVSNIDYDTNVARPGAEAFLYVAGSDLRSGSWRVYSLANPAQPQLITEAPTGTQYMHDSTSLYLTDSRASQCEPGHNPCEVLVDFNENTVDLWDVTNKNLPVRLSSTTYQGATYTHSGWPSADQQFLFMHDELEEIQRGFNTQLYTLNLSNLRAPSITTSYQGSTTTTDHNGYTKGNFYYVSHYRRGLTVFDATNPNQLREVAHLDTFLAPAANSAGTDGAWGVYPFFPSGTVVISDISNGLFVLKDRSATLASSAGQIGFIGTTVTVGENAGVATVRLHRSGGYMGAVSIQYATSDGTATTGSDYTATSGTLSWPAFDTTEKSFAVPLTNDAQIESDETLSVTLSSAGGGASIEGSPTFAITVSNDDVAAPPPAPPSNGGGGGGAIGADVLVLLLASGLWRFTSPRRRRTR